MKILVINPPGPDDSFYLREGRCMHKTDVWTSILPPISLVLIGTLLKNCDLNVMVIDSAAENLNFSEIEQIINHEKFDLVFINTGTPTISTDLYVATLAKSANPSAITCAFGIHVSALPEETFNINPSLDIIIRGEPEISAREIALALLNSTNLVNIKGISFKNSGKIHHNPERVWIENLDELPIPDWSLVPYKKYIIPLRFRPYFYVVTSRGCPYNCSFCAQHIYYGRNVRLRSPEKIVEEIKFLLKRYGVIDFMFWADTFTIDRNHTIELCQKIIKENLKIYWTTTTRVDLVDEEILRLMKKAGCWLIVHGIESGTGRRLNDMRKNITIEQIIRTIEIEKKVGLKVIGHFIIGYPDETEEDINRTIDFSTSLPLDFAQFYFATPFPGSELYELCKSKNILESSDWKLYEQDRVVIKNQFLTTERLYQLRRKAYRKFYWRPTTIKKNIKYLMSYSGISYIFHNLKPLLKLFTS